MTDLAPGKPVWHETRGAGTVVEHLTDPARIVIRFHGDNKTSKYAKHSWDKLSSRPPVSCQSRRLTQAKMKNGVKGSGRLQGGGGGSGRLSPIPSSPGGGNHALGRPAMLRKTPSSGL
eukprot:685668-Prymnesium_polylepis.1